MKEGRERQDVAFLALVVAVLAVAVALFVGMKSIRRDKPKKQEPRGGNATEVAGPVVSKPAGGPRDPFKTGEGEKTGVKPGGAVGAEQTLKLVGIVSEQGDRPVAIIHSTKKRYYARVGDRVAGHTLVSISANEVVLEKAGQKVALPLREPEATDE